MAEEMKQIDWTDDEAVVTAYNPKLMLSSRQRGTQSPSYFLIDELEREVTASTLDEKRPWGFFRSADASIRTWERHHNPSLQPPALAEELSAESRVFGVFPEAYQSRTGKVWTRKKMPRMYLGPSWDRAAWCVAERRQYLGLAPEAQTKDVETVRKSVFLPDDFEIDAVQSWAQGCSLAEGKPYLKRASEVFVATLETADELQRSAAQLEVKLQNQITTLRDQAEQIGDVVSRIAKTVGILDKTRSVHGAEVLYFAEHIERHLLESLPPAPAEEVRLPSAYRAMSVDPWQVVCAATEAYAAIDQARAQAAQRLRESRAHYESAVRWEGIANQAIAERDARDEENAGLRKRIHQIEGHNQYFFRCESAWCHPSDQFGGRPALDNLKGAMARAEAAEGKLAEMLAALILAKESMVGNNSPFDPEVWARAVDAVVAAIPKVSTPSVAPKEVGRGWCGLCGGDVSVPCIHMKSIPQQKSTPPPTKEPSNGK